MIILDATTKSLQIILSGAVTTTQLPFVASWADHAPATPAFTPGETDGTSNGTTAVTAVAAPAASVQRQIKQLSVFNSDTAPATVTIRYNNNGTFRTILAATLQVGEKIQYEDGQGFIVFTALGAVKVTAVATTVEPGYIDGMILSWNSNTSISVSSGSYYVPSVGFNVNSPATITKAGLALAASTFYHVYGFLNSGVPDVEIVTTVPSSPYNGSAKTKTGDTTRRYLGSILTDASSNVYNFRMAGTTLMYQGFINNPVMVVLNTGTATAETTVNLAGVIPVGTQVIKARHSNSSNTSSRMNNTSAVFPQYVMNFASLADSFLEFAINPALTVSYWLNAVPASGGVTIQVYGYMVER